MVLSRYAENAALERLLDYPSGGLVGANYVDVVYLDDSADDARDLRALAGGELAGYEREVRLIRSDGDIRWARVRATLLPPVQRTHEAVVIRFVEDLTAQRRAALQHEATEDSVKRAYSEVIAAVTGDRLLVLREDELRSRLGRVISPAQRLTEPGQLPRSVRRLDPVLRREFPGLATTDQLLLAASEALTNALKHAGGGTLEIRKMGTPGADRHHRRRPRDRLRHASSGDVGLWLLDDERVAGCGLHHHARGVRQRAAVHGAAGDDRGARRTRRARRRERQRWLAGRPRCSVCSPSFHPARRVGRYLGGYKRGSPRIVPRIALTAGIEKRSVCAGKDPHGRGAHSRPHQLP